MGLSAKVEPKEFVKEPKFPPINRAMGGGFWLKKKKNLAKLCQIFFSNPTKEKLRENKKNKFQIQGNRLGEFGFLLGIKNKKFEKLETHFGWCSRVCVR